MTRIYKWKLPFGESEIEVPGAWVKALTVQMQDLTPVVWAEIDVDAKESVVRLAGIVTGAKTPIGGEYIGTVQLHHGEFVLHYYRLP
jgi:hypothetical protein